MGVLLGIDEINNQFSEAKELENYDLIYEIASDLYEGCPDNGYDKDDPYWDSKYLYFKSVAFDDCLRNKQYLHYFEELNSDQIKAINNLYEAFLSDKEYSIIFDESSYVNILNAFNDLNLEDSYDQNEIHKYAFTDTKANEFFLKTNSLSSRDLGNLLYSIVKFRRESDIMGGKFSKEFNKNLSYICMKLFPVLDSGLSKIEIFINPWFKQNDYPTEMLIILHKKGENNHYDYFGEVHFCEYMRGTDMCAHSGDYSFGDFNCKNKDQGYCKAAFCFTEILFEKNDNEKSLETPQLSFEIKASYLNGNCRTKYYTGTFKDNGLEMIQHFLKKAINTTKNIEVLK